MSHLKQGLSKAEALREAQVDARQNFLILTTGLDLS